MQGFMINKTKRLLKRASTRDALRRQQEQEEEQLRNDAQKRITSSLDHLTMQCRFPSLTSLVNFSLTTNGSAPTRPDPDRCDKGPQMKRPLHKTHSFSATSIGLQIGLPSPSKSEGQSTQVCVQMPLDVIVDPSSGDMVDGRSNRFSTNKFPVLGGSNHASQPSRNFKPLQRAKSCYITLLYPSMQEEDCENESVSSDERGGKSGKSVSLEATAPSTTDTQSVPLDHKEIMGIPSQPHDLTFPERAENISQNVNDSTNHNIVSSNSRIQIPGPNSNPNQDITARKPFEGILKQDSSSQLAQLRSRLKYRSRHYGKDYGKPFDSILNDPQREINGNEDEDECDIELGRYIDVFRRPLSPALAEEVPLEDAPNETNDDSDSNSSISLDKNNSSSHDHSATKKEQVSQETITVHLQEALKTFSDVTCPNSAAEFSSDKAHPNHRHSSDLRQAGIVEKTEILSNSEPSHVLDCEGKTPPSKTVPQGNSKRRNSIKHKNSPTKHSSKGSKDSSENVKDSNKRRSSFTKTVQNGKAFLSTLPPFTFRQLFQKKQFSTIPILPPIGSSKKYQVPEHKENLSKDESRSRHQKGKSFYTPKQPDKPMSSGIFQRRNRRITSDKSHAHTIPNDESSKVATSRSCSCSAKTLTNQADTRSHFQVGPFKRIDVDKNKQGRHVMEVSPYFNFSKKRSSSRRKAVKEEARSCTKIETSQNADV